MSKKISVIFQDHEGFIWIGTTAGLQRYDGTRFKNYTADLQDTNALQSDWISAIFEDSKKRLWIGTDHGAPYIFNPNTGTFYNYNSHALPGNKINGLWHFTEDKQGSVWIAAHDGFYCLNDTTNQFEKYNARLGIDKQAGTGYLSIDSDDNLWLATTKGVMFYNRKEQKLYNRYYNPKKLPIFNINIGIANMIKSGNQLWINTGYHRFLYRYDFTTRKLKTYTFDILPSTNKNLKFRTEMLSQVFELRNGTIIVPLVGRGLALYLPKQDSFIIINANQTKPYAYHVSENSNGDAWVCMDNEKNIWIGNDAGISIYNQDKQYFFTHGLNRERDTLFPNSSVTDFLQLKNNDILLSYYNIDGGIVRIDSAYNFKKRYAFDSKSGTNIICNQIWNLFKDNHDIVWGPNQNYSITKLDLNTDKLSEDVNIVRSGPITTIVQDEEDNIWLGHWKKGLVREEVATHKITFFNHFLFADSTTPKRIQSILLDGDKIWVGSNQNGLQVFDKKSELFSEAFVIDERNKTAISNNSVLDILRYNRDTLVIATEMGINFFDLRTKTFKAMTTRDGLPSNFVLTIVKDENGYIWASCANDGFCKINMHDFSVTKYEVADGITDNGFLSKFYKLKNGHLLIGASGSFISFNPKTITTSEPPPDVRITSVHVFEKEILIDTLVKTHQALELSYEDNSLRIEFSSLLFWMPGSLDYYYKLLGVDKDWIHATKSLAAVYNQLNDGNFVFTVKCKNRDGIFSDNITQFSIIIHPPFWKTWWFISIISFCIFLLLFLFVKWREYNLETIASEKLKVQQLNSEQYKSKLELEQIINYFSFSLIDKITIDDVLWDVAKNLFGQLGFVDCMIYQWNDDKTKMIQKAGYGPKGSVEEIIKQPFDVVPGQGVVGFVMQSKEPVIIEDTSKDSRYRADEIIRLSEITVPIIYNNELIGVIDCEHHEKNFYTQQHLQVLSTIATLMANKIKSIEAEQSLHHTQLEMYSMNEQLSKAKLEALRSQMNPHFMFNSLNAIQECILTNKVDEAYEYLSKFSKLQRIVLHNSEKELIPLSSELEMLDLYLSLESLRFSNSFSYSFHKQSETDANEIMIPSLITQPLVENAIWHGLRNKEGKKELEIAYEEKKGTILITIDDNGIGREKAALIRNQKLGSSQFASKGTQMLQQRLHVIRQHLKVDLHLEIIDKKDALGIAIGTKVVISFPANLESIGEDS